MVGYPVDFKNLVLESHFVLNPTLQIRVLRHEVILAFRNILYETAPKF